MVTFFSGPLIPVFLITIYGKGAKDTLTKAERNALFGLTTDLVAAYGPRIVKLRSRS